MIDFSFGRIDRPAGVPALVRLDDLEAAVSALQAAVEAGGTQGPEGPRGLQGEQGPIGPRGDPGPEGPQGPAGAQGERGADGTAVSIKGQFATVGELPASGSVGDAYLIGGDLHVWTGAAWQNVGSIKGPKGDKGDPGETGATGAKGNKGDTGAAGADGAKGDKGDPGDKGDKGDKGDTGEQGEPGPAYDDTAIQLALANVIARVEALEGTGPSVPTVITAPTATPTTSQVGDPITLTLGTWDKGTPTGVLMQGGVNRTSEISGGVWTPAQAGAWTWTVTNGAAVPVVISGEVTGEVAFSVVDVDGVMHVSGTGDVTWDLIAPPEYAGEFTHDQSVEYSGPLNIGYTENTAPQCVVKPTFQRHSGPGTTEHYPGTAYSYTPGLWISSASKTWTLAHEWYEDGVATGYTGPLYTRAGVGPVEIRETATVPGQALRTSRSVAVTGEVQPTVTLFDAAPDNTLLKDYPDPAGRQFTVLVPAHDGHRVHSGYVRSTWSHNGVSFVYAAQDEGATWVKARIKLPVTGAYSGAEYFGIGLHIQPAPGQTANQNNMQGYYHMIRLRDFHRLSGRKDPGGAGGEPYLVPFDGYPNGTLPAADYSGRDLEISMFSEGNDVVIAHDGVEVARWTETTHRGGHGAIGFVGNTATGSMALPQGLYQFDAGIL